MQGKTSIMLVIYAFMGILVLSAAYGMSGLYMTGTLAPMAVLEFDIEGNYSDPIIENATFNLEHVKTAQIPTGEMDMPVPGVGIIVFNEMKRASYSSTQSYTGQGHYRFKIGFEEEIPQYNDTLAIAVHFFDGTGRFDRAQIFTRWRWNGSDY